MVGSASRRRMGLADIVTALSVASCSRDADCASVNARCYPDIAASHLQPSSVPFNNSQNCYCDLWFVWIGPQCSEYSTLTILIAFSCITIAAISLVLGFIALKDTKDLVQSSQCSVSRIIRRTDGRSIDVQIVTCTLMSLALLSLGGWMIVDALSALERRTCTDSNLSDIRTTCYVRFNLVFLCGVPLIGTPLILLVSVLVFNASYRTTALLRLPLGSFMFLCSLEACLLAALIATAIVEQYSIASYAGAAFAFITAVINMMSWWRLWVYPRFTTTSGIPIGRGGPSGATNIQQNNTVSRKWSYGSKWSVKDKLAMISVAIGLLNFAIAICLVIRGYYNETRSSDAVLGRYSQTSEHIFRWCYLGILTIYFYLVHSNARRRLNAQRRRQNHDDLPHSSGAPEGHNSEPTVSTPVSPNVRGYSTRFNAEQTLLVGGVRADDSLRHLNRMSLQEQVIEEGDEWEELEDGVTETAFHDGDLIEEKNPESKCHQSVLWVAPNPTETLDLS